MSGMPGSSKIEPVHKTEKMMYVLGKFFEDRIIFKGWWPVRSPDLTSPDFFSYTTRLGLQGIFKK